MINSAFNPTRSRTQTTAISDHQFIHLSTTEKCTPEFVQTYDSYPSGHLVPSPILGLANAPIVETKFLELAMSLLDFSPRIPLGTFSILL